MNAAADADTAVANAAMSPSISESEDVARAEAEVRRAWAPTQGEPGTRASRWLNILGLTGSEFPLEVDPLVTVQEICQVIVEKVDIEPGSMLELLCCLSVLDEAGPVLQQT